MKIIGRLEIQKFKVMILLDIFLIEIRSFVLLLFNIFKIDNLFDKRLTDMWITYLLTQLQSNFETLI